MDTSSHLMLVTLTEATTEDLLRGARAGDGAATASLISGMRDRIYRWALVISGDHDDAEDVTQQVCLTLHRKLGDFESRSRFTTWLYAIVRNASTELSRKASRRYELRIDPAVMDNQAAATDASVKQLEDASAAALIRAFFAELPPRQRELIELIDSDGRTAAEAAEMMGIEPETARVHLMRARRTIRSKMLELYPEVFA